MNPKVGVRVRHSVHGTGVVNRIVPASVHGLAYFRITWDRPNHPAHNSLHPARDLSAA